MNIFSKLLFIIRKPKIVLLVGDNPKKMKRIIFRILGQHFKFEKDFLVLEISLDSISKFSFLIKHSSLPVLVLNNDIQSEKLKNLPNKIQVVLNLDNEGAGEFASSSGFQCLKFGFSSRADIIASDVNVNGGINFKINYQGNVVPVWLEKSDIPDKVSVHNALAAASVGILFDLNLVEISQALKGD